MSLFHPFLAVSVSIETNRLAGLYVLAKYVDDCANLALAICHKSVNTLSEADESLCHCGIEGYHSRGAVGLAAYGAELEPVASEGKRGGAVAVGVVDDEVGNLRNVNFHSLFALDVE